MSRTYLLCVLIALMVMDGYVNDFRGARSLLRAGQSMGEKVDASVDRVVGKLFGRAQSPAR